MKTKTYLSPETIAALVHDKQTAKVVVAELLARFSTDSARSTLHTAAQKSKQSLKTASRRFASNLLSRNS